jgi:hypothetical protein
MARRLLPHLVLLGCVTACEPSVVSQSELLTTRVLAIRADPPELVVPADGGLPPPVHFTVLAFAPSAAPVVTLALCLSGDPYSADFACPGANGITLPDDTLDVTNPEIAALLLGLGGGLPDAGLAPEEPGVLQVAIGYFATTGGTESGASERGVYRLGVRFSGNPNHNPQLLGVSLPDGGSLEGAPLPLGQDVTLTPHIPGGGPDSAWPSVGVDGGIETYPSLDGGILYENLNYSWYASLTAISDFRSREPTPADTAETATTQFNASDPGPVTFYVVLRDGRGGTDWKILDGTVVPSTP